MGMAMTEKQGGSDVRANSTVATPISGSTNGEYTLVGHKWFCSAPQSDAFLTLAKTPDSNNVSCFFVPRWRPDGTKNTMHLMRFKDKLGNKSNASSEIEYHGAWAKRVGAEGKGVSTIINMVNHTRLDCQIGAAALMRVSVAHATHHAAHRKTFGNLLINHTTMKNVLADLCVESEAATATFLRIAQAFDNSESSASERAFGRIANAIGKYWICKRAPQMVYESLECLGGNGYVEDSMMPRFFRESPLNAIWEGSGNVICLDVLRALRTERESGEALYNELAKAKGADKHYDALLHQIHTDLNEQDVGKLEGRARMMVERMAIALQASVLLLGAPRSVSEAYVRSRVAGQGGHFYGTLPGDIKFDDIIMRSRPRV
eukprot:Colp12_sorted_trinity150504_noHs@5216